jgi:hypothetical protein
MSGALEDPALNRALLARQGLLERLDEPLEAVVERIGAMQGQAWNALPPGLWSRMSEFAPGDLYAALDAGDLRWGILIRGTLHLVSTREHPAYAVVAAATTDAWARALKQTTDGMRELRAALLEFAAADQRTGDDVREFAEEWVAAHPKAIEPEEVEAQRGLGWRPIVRWSSLVRVPAGGTYGAKAPAEHRAAPVPPGSPRAPKAPTALLEVARRHLRAFGPAAAEDVAGWTGHRTPAVRECLEGAGDELERAEDEHGRTLYDLPGAARPDPGIEAPPRLLGAFDSSLLAYAGPRRERILPDALRDLVVQRRNLQVRPTFLIDGLVAGVWAIEVKRGEAKVTLASPTPIPRGERKALTEEAQGLAAALHPRAKAHRVEVTRS